MPLHSIEGLPTAEEPRIDLASKRPLEGVKVLEFGHVASGPFAAMVLADLGADVVKLESPNGDQMRQWPPLASHSEEGEFSYNFASINRNKRSFVADLKSKQEFQQVEQLCLAADAIVENYRPGIMDKLGLGFQSLAPRHRGLVYCSISGFGQTGEYRTLGAYDVVVQAMSGMMSVTGTTEGELVKSGVPFGDFVTGLYAALAVSAWIPLARSGGRSFRLDAPMLDCLLATSALQTSEYWGTGQKPVPLGTAHPRNAPYQVFESKDSRFVLAAGNDVLWKAVCDALGEESLADDPRFASQIDRVKNQRELTAHLADRFKSRSSAEWIEVMRSHGVPAGPVNTYEEILTDRAFLSGGLVRNIAAPVIGEMHTTVFPVRVDGLEPRLDLGPPRLGEHTEEILSDWVKDDGGGNVRLSGRRA